MRFATRFDKNYRKEHIRSERDEVDRVSYVDSTLMIKRFISEGRNLAQYRAAALRHGVYQADIENQDVKDPIVPVYDTDPAILAPVIDAAREAFETAGNGDSERSEAEPSPAVDKETAMQAEAEA